MKKSGIILLMYLIAFQFTSCSYLDGETGALYRKLEKKYAKKLEICYTPAEYYYLMVILKTKNIDSALLDSLCKDMYDIEKKVGWKTLHVFDSNNNHIFNYSSELKRQEIPKKY